MSQRGKLTTDALGRSWFRSLRPAGYPIPTEGVVGRFERHEESHPDDPDVETPWCSLDHTFVMEPGEARVAEKTAGPDDGCRLDGAVFG